MSNAEDSLHEDLLNRTPKCVSVVVKYVQLVNVLFFSGIHKVFLTKCPLATGSETLSCCVGLLFQGTMNFV